MENLKIAIVGGHGQLGRSLQKWKKENKPKGEWSFYSSGEMDVADKNNLNAVFQKDGPFDFVVNCAAYTAVDKAENESEKAQNINAVGIGLLAEVCQKFDSALIHISTDFVFDGRISRPLKETDAPNPLGVYGRTKYDGEKRVVQSLDRHFILRTGWLYSTFSHNFLNTMLRLGKERENLDVVADQVGTPTHTAVLVKVIEKIINTASRAYGIYHVANEGVASWYDFAYEIMKMSGNGCRVNPILSVDYPTAAERPAYSVLDKTKVKTTFDLNLPHWKESLETCF